jgi:tellurite resistance protein
MSEQAQGVARIPLNTFAIGFGLVGLAEVWSAAGATLALPTLLVQAFWAIAAVGWLWLIVAHLVRGARSPDTLRSQLRNPTQAPMATLVPTTAMLLAADLRDFVPLAGLILFIVAVVAAALFAGWLIATWLQGGLALESVHGGYLLPTVAAGLVGADAAAHVGLLLLGWALFGVGVFFWAVLTVIVILRLALRPSLPDPLVPTMAILVAPPAVGGIAWFALDGLHAGPVAAMLAGLGVLLLLVQLALIPKYRKLTFSLGFWSFTFSTAAVVAVTVLWVRIADFPGCKPVTVVLLVAVTAFIAAIAARSLVARFSRA